jgi:hypothetical protein
MMGQKESKKFIEKEKKREEKGGVVHPNQVKYM